MEKKLDGNYTRMLRAILNKSWQQHPTRHQLYGQLPPITKTIPARRTRHAGHCWRSKDELVSDLLLWTPAYGQSKAGRPARTYIQQLCDHTRCNTEDLPEAMNDRETWRERGSGISVLAARHDDDDDSKTLCVHFVFLSLFIFQTIIVHSIHPFAHQQIAEVTSATISKTYFSFPGQKSFFEFSIYLSI